MIDPTVTPKYTNAMRYDFSDVEIFHSAVSIGNKRPKTID